MPALFRYVRRIEFAETDMAGIVHFANFFRYMEEAEHAYFRSLGLTIHNKREDGTVVSWPRVSVSCTFEAPARFEDEIDIHLEVSQIGTKSLEMSFEFYNGSQRLACGKVKTVCCEFVPGRQMRSIEIPGEYREKIAASTGQPSDEVSAADE